MGWPREELDAPSLVWDQGGEGLVQEATLRATRPLSATLSLGNAPVDIVSGTFSGQTWTWRAWTPWCSTSLICCRVVDCLRSPRPSTPGRPASQPAEACGGPPAVAGHLNGRHGALFVSCFLLCLLATRDLGASTSTFSGGRSIISQ